MRRVVFAVLLLAVSNPSAQTCGEGALTWEGIVPTCLAPGSQYRILFVTSGETTAASASIETYNAFVQSAANGVAGNPFNGITFNALGSTQGMDARDNTNTNRGRDGSGEPIFYYLGEKVADHYSDFYDESWDSQTPTNEHGNTVSAADFTGNDLFVWTGSRSDGTGGGGFFNLGGGTPLVGEPRTNSRELDGFNSLPGSQLRPLYSLSEVLATRLAVTGLALNSAGADGVYVGGDTIEVTVTFAAAVTVSGANVSAMSTATVTLSASNLTDSMDLQASASAPEAESDVVVTATGVAGGVTVESVARLVADVVSAVRFRIRAFLEGALQ